MPRQPGGQSAEQMEEPIGKIGTIFLVETAVTGRGLMGLN